MKTGYYYLHVNGDLIFKNGTDSIVDIQDSDLCESAWYFDSERPSAWRLLVEGLCLGALKNRVEELAKLWKCDDEDAKEYANYIGIELGIDGSHKTAFKKDFENLQESPCGFGLTYLEAMSDLCKQLGYVGSKYGGSNGFKYLVKK